MKPSVVGESDVFQIEIDVKKDFLPNDKLDIGFKCKVFDKELNNAYLAFCPFFIRMHHVNACSVWLGEIGQILGTASEVDI